MLYPLHYLGLVFLKKGSYQNEPLPDPPGILMKIYAIPPGILIESMPDPRHTHGIYARPPGIPDAEPLGIQGSQG